MVAVDVRASSLDPNRVKALELAVQLSIHHPPMGTSVVLAAGIVTYAETFYEFLAKPKDG